ncbi:TPA: hypothetical protein ACXNW8_003442 [Clostridium botulinum]
MEQTIIELCGEIMEIAAKITLLTKTEVFVELSGHVKWFEVKVYKNGWSNQSEPTFSDTVRLDPEDVDLKFTIKTLRGIRDTLRKLYKNGHVSSKNFAYEEEIIKHYKFK